MDLRNTRPKEGRQNTVSLETLTTPFSLKMTLIPAGEFIMGPVGDDPLDKPRHKVRITRPFYLGTYQVTQREWMEVMGKNPSKFIGDDNPVEWLSWEDCQLFIGRLNDIEHGSYYRLPSEAEWEYACRAGTTTRYYFGNEDSDLDDYGWYDWNAGCKTHPVGKKQPNAWGLYDMHGNVKEWCMDWFNENYYAECHKQGTVEDPAGPRDGTFRVLRGGSWFDGANGSSTSSMRDWTYPGTRNNDFGFRLAKSV